jgi:hypothetical protein
MSPKPLRAGGEVDSFCTKCRLVLNHRIIAMLGSVPKRVECSTCSSHHNYRARPPGEKAETMTAGAGRTTPAPRTTRASTHTKAAQAENARQLSWEKATSGKPVTDFVVYKVMLNFNEGDLLRHSRFGDGVVMRVIDAHKVEVMFKDEARTLAQGLVD